MPSPTTTTRDGLHLRGRLSLSAAGRTHGGVGLELGRLQSFGGSGRLRVGDAQRVARDAMLASSQRGHIKRKPGRGTSRLPPPALAIRACSSAHGSLQLWHNASPSIVWKSASGGTAS